MIITIACLIVVCAILLREVSVLHACEKAQAKELTLLSGRIEEMHRRLRATQEGARTDATRLSEVERQAAANEAALELQDVSIDNHENALRAVETLSILHAENVTRLEGRIARIERNPFHVPVRRDN